MIPSPSWPRRRPVAAALLAIAIVVSGLCGAPLPSRAQAPAVPPLYGVDFGPYVVPGQDPNTGGVVSSSQITALLSPLQSLRTPSGQPLVIRTFGTQNGLENVPRLAKQMGFKTAIGAYIGSDPTVNAAQIASLISLAQAGYVDIAIVGNEVLLGNSQTEARLLAYIQEVKSQVPAGVQVTTVDTWNTMVAHPNVIAAVDVVAVNIYPFYENASIAQAVSVLKSDYAATVQAANGKPVIVTETGWPGSGNSPSSSPNAVPSSANAATYLNGAAAWAESANAPLIYFEAYDEPFKASYNDYPSWGILPIPASLTASTPPPASTSSGGSGGSPAAAPGNGGGGGGGACFIATAAYGSYLEPHVMVLRRFRDAYLLTNRPGRWLVMLYYATSPPCADFIARHPALRLVTHLALTPLVLGIEHPLGFCAALGLLLLGWRLRRASPCREWRIPLTPAPRFAACRGRRHP